MIKYLFAILLILFQLGNAQSGSGNQPSAKCQTGFFMKILPLITNQSYITSLDSLFNGYNLQYKLKDAEDFQDYITVKDKLILQTKQVPDLPLIGLKNYHIDKRGNTWGSNFIALSQRSQRTYVHYGVMNSNKSAPVINNYILVENSTNTTCYDAVNFFAKGLILVDCVVKLKTPNSKGQILQNVFYYFRISDGSFVRKLKNQMYVNFRNIQRRSLLLYSDLRNQHTFLLRTYFFDGMDKQTKSNTYVDVFMISDPQDPWIVQVIDRSFLQTPTLQITDIRIYLGQIFILDNKLGIYRVYINTEQDLQLNGFFQVKGFQRFSVYSNNLDNHFQLALANSHSVYELDWSNKLEPRLLNKYSLMPDSKVSQVFLNQRFVFVQSQSTSDNLAFNYTWILNRGSRTYTKAFKIIKHKTSKVFIDLNEDMTYLIIMDDQRLVNYAVDDSNMIIKIKRDQQLLDKVNSFTVQATSTDPMNNGSVKVCQLQINFTLLQDNNRTMWPIGQAPPSHYTANYPGKVLVKLHEYVLGPNISYKIRQTDKDLIKKQKVYQQQQLNIKWSSPQHQPPFQTVKMKFLQTQTINHPQKTYDQMMIYLQDENNKTYFSQCLPDHTLMQVICNQTRQQQFQGQINNMVTGFFMNRYSGEYHHIIAYTTTKRYNKISLMDNTKKEKIDDILLQKGYAGNITSIGITNKQLYVVLKYVKNIQIYDLQLCLQGICQPKCQLNHLKMYKLGIKYYSPTQVHTSIFHQNIIFIKTSDQIIVVDYSAQCKPKLVTILNPVELAQIQFTFKINPTHMLVIIGGQNIIREYSLERLELGQIRMTKQYPRYGYKLPKNYDFDVSDKSNCAYITMVNQGGDYNIFVYKTGQPAVGSLYDVIDLYTFQYILVDSTGYQIDYVTVYSDKKLRIFRQYQQPLGQVYNPNISYSFYLQYSNPTVRSNLQLINVQIINLPTYIKVNPQLNDIMNTKDLLYSGNNKVNQIDDSDWWQGNVLRIVADCKDCGQAKDNKIIKVNNHIQEERIQTLIPFMSTYQWNTRGGSIQSYNSIINIKHNGTIDKFVKLPFNKNQYCIDLAVGSHGNINRYQVSGCLSTDNQVIYLYLTSYLSQKPFAFEPYQTTANNILKLQAINELIILVDTQPNPYYKTKPGGIYLYGINQDDQIDTSFILVEYIDWQDLGMEQLKQLYINNAQLTYNQETKTYRLYFTQMTRGLFVIDFKYSSVTNILSIRNINRIQIQPLLKKLNYQLPYDCTYQAIIMTSSNFNPTLKKITQSLLITTGKFHTIHLLIDYDIYGNVLSSSIKRLYMRYSYYDVQNYIKFHDNMFIISQTIPEQYQIANRSKQLLTIYSIQDKKKQQRYGINLIVQSNQQTYNKNIQIQQLNKVYDITSQKEVQKQQKRKGLLEQRGFLGAYKINNHAIHNYDFNLTYQNDNHNTPRIGLVLIQNTSNILQKFTLHQNLSIVTKQMVNTQIIFIDLYNDFSLQKIRILINGYGTYPEWKLITIILFSIIGGIIFIGGILILVKKIKQKQSNDGQEYNEQVNNNYNQSLITSSDRRSYQPNSINRQSSQSYNKMSKKQQEKIEKQKLKDQKRLQKQREKQEKIREKEQKQKQKQRQKQQRLRQKQKNKMDKQNNKQRFRNSERQRQYQRQQQRQKQRQRERERQRQKQRQIQQQRNKRNQRSFQPSYNTNNYESNRIQEPTFKTDNLYTSSTSRYGTRIRQRNVPQPPSNNRQPPQQTRNRNRNVVIDQ